ncbi:MAG: hydrogenase maturation nickel metallochaperone HypA [Gammaproteobacteria bacterium]|nr:hydrogenase maturation nickel metallochaperone HypA [Gammaproteobacteria bacterium]MBU2545567.1 hydrogenase maturation nickel metallochaperone HypA [Gammaproteobacteria bacterium]
MHELTLCRNIVDIALDALEGDRKVHAVILELGLLAGVQKEALLFSFDVVVQNTALEGSKLVIIDVPGKAKCNQCATLFSIQKLYDACPECRSHDFQLLSGEELNIKSLEVE